MQQADARRQFFDLLRAAISDRSLSKLTLGKYRGTDASLQNVFVRPVSLKGGPRLGFVFRHATRDITKNHPPGEAVPLLEKLIGGDFLDAHLFTTTRTARLACATGGAARFHTRALPENTGAHPAPPRAHDKARRQAIPLDAPWLQALGVTNNHARPREGMADKLRQINKFAELLSHLALEAKLISEPRLVPPDAGGVVGGDAARKEAPGTPASASGPAPAPAPAQPLRIADMGCGKGYLTFAAAALFGPRARVQGIEARPELVEFCNRVAREQHFDNLSFVQGAIAGAALPGNALDILVALHACDTATDDAIARGIQAGARLIVVSPCCQKELRRQLTAPPVLAEALRHGIFQERHAEFVTDALRARLLEYAGYRAKVFEFVSTGHTAKNLMIAAMKTRDAGDAETLRDLRAFARFYGIRKQALATRLNVGLAS